MIKLNVDRPGIANESLAGLTPDLNTNNRISRVQSQIARTGDLLSRLRFATQASAHRHCCNLHIHRKGRDINLALGALLLRRHFTSRLLNPQMS